MRNPGTPVVKAITITDVARFLNIRVANVNKRVPLHRGCLEAEWCHVEYVTRYKPFYSPRYSDKVKKVYSYTSSIIAI